MKTTTENTLRIKIIRLIGIALAVFTLDQACKYYMLEVVDIAARSPIRLSENVALVMAWNRGVSFSMFAHEAEWMPYVLIAVALAICAVLVRLCLKSADRVERFGYAVIVGGALGNVIDRVRFGAVADFFYVHVGEYGWPAFNIADASICAGVALLLWRVLKKPASA
jgi:signal peptidase II